MKQIALVELRIYQASKIISTTHLDIAGVREKIKIIIQSLKEIIYKKHLIELGSI